MVDVAIVLVCYMVEEVVVVAVVGVVMDMVANLKHQASN